MLPLDLTLSLGGPDPMMTELFRAPRLTGPGKRSILTMHRKIEADARRDTPGAQRMRDIVGRRRANWQR